MDGLQGVGGDLLALVLLGPELLHLPGWEVALPRAGGVTLKVNKATDALGTVSSKLDWDSLGTTGLPLAVLPSPKVQV